MTDALEKPYRSIREVSEAMAVKPHVLRYWETQFSMLRPRKNRAGVRMYRQKDLDLLKEIRHLLYDRGFTIAGARRTLMTERKGNGGEPAPAEAGQQEFDLGHRTQPILREIRKELAQLHALLSGVPGSRPPAEAGAEEKPGVAGRDAHAHERRVQA